MLVHSLRLVVIASLLVGAVAFAPDTRGLQYEALLQSIPLVEPLLTSQNFHPVAMNSWWISSFLHASNNHNYFLISQVAAGNNSYYHRSSILDITNPRYHQQFQTSITNGSAVSSQTSPPLNINLGDYGIQALERDSDPLHAIRFWNTNPGVEFNLTFQLSAPILLNGGTGYFPWGNVMTEEWSMPAGLTTGSLTINNTKLSIDSSASQTWYDRQITWADAPVADNPLKANWTWLQIHLEDGETRSTWIWDAVDGERTQFETVRYVAGTHTVIPLEGFLAVGGWTSPRSGIRYPQEWRLVSGDGTRFRIRSLRADQEMAGEHGEMPVYEGYMTLTATRSDGSSVDGYGVVEIVAAGSGN